MLPAEQRGIFKTPSLADARHTNLVISISRGGHKLTIKLYFVCELHFKLLNMVLPLIKAPYLVEDGAKP